MLSKERNFLFIHYPKTGGNSVQTALMKYSRDKVVFRPNSKDNFEIKMPQTGLSKHATLKEYKAKLSPALFKGLYKFSIIRNPWERVISLYFWIQNLGKAPPVWRKDICLAMLEERVILRSRLRNFIGLARRRFFRKRALDADIDYLMRYENLEEDFAHVCKQIGIAPIALPHRNKTEHMHYSRYYDDDMVALVAQRFQEEIAFGGYTFERR